MKKKIGVLMGGNSLEHDVSLLSAKEILNSLDNLKYDVIPIEIPSDTSTKWVNKIIEVKPDIILSALHGGIGENGAVQGLLDCLRIPYVGSKVMGSAICMDKAMSKLIMRSNHIPVIDDVFIPRNENIINYEEKINELGFPLVVKPNSGGSSIGISIVNSIVELKHAISVVTSYDDDILIEKYIRGQEVSCGLLQTKNNLEVLTVVDISTTNLFYDYEAKYQDNITRIDFSALPKYQQVMIQEIAKKVFVCLHCHGYARVDMIVIEEQIYVLEMNTLPGLTSYSSIPKSVQGNNLKFSEFLESLIQYELTQ